MTLANDFQQQRVKLMEKAVAAAEETMEHLKAWRTLSHVVVPFLGQSPCVAIRRPGAGETAAGNIA
ncbi:hypothetical protein J7E80_21180 [Arthrobacter sp. ISL-28]|nr:hypothetical protein [Arthrobacter sp. ISL-28]